MSSLLSCTSAAKVLPPGSIHFSLSTNYSAAYHDLKTRPKSVQVITRCSYIPQGRMEFRSTEHWQGDFEELVWSNEEKWTYTWLNGRLNTESYWNRDRKQTLHSYYIYDGSARPSARIIMDSETNQVSTYYYSNELLVLEEREYFPEHKKEVLYQSFTKKGLLKSQQLRLGDTQALTSSYFQYDDRGFLKKSIVLNGEGEVLWGREFKCNSFGHIVYEEEFGLDEYRKKSKNPALTYTYYIYY